MKRIKNVKPKIRLLPCRYCGRVPDIVYESKYTYFETIITTKIQCACDHLISTEVFSNGKTLVFKEPLQTIWNEKQREVKK